MRYGTSTLTPALAPTLSPKPTPTPSVVVAETIFFGPGSGFHKVSTPAPAPATARTCEHNFFAEKIDVFL